MVDLAVFFFGFKKFSGGEATPALKIRAYLRPFVSGFIKEFIDHSPNKRLLAAKTQPQIHSC